MSIENLISGVLLAVITIVITDPVKDIVKKVRKTPNWIKDSFRFGFCLVMCIAYSAQAALSYSSNSTRFVLSVCVVAVSSFGLVVLFCSYRLAFDSIYKLSEKLLDNRSDEMPQKCPDKNS